MQITVKYANAAKEGKKFGSIVGADDVRFPCPPALVAQFEKGQTYEVETKPEKWGDQMVQVIKGIKSNGHAAPSSGDKWWMPFVSNTVAHAIQAGLIKGPGEISTWARAARNVAEDLPKLPAKPASFEDMDDDIPL